VALQHFFCSRWSLLRSGSGAGLFSVATFSEGGEVEGAPDDVVADSCDGKVVMLGVAVDADGGLVDGYGGEPGDHSFGLFHEDLFGCRVRRWAGARRSRFG
jgi:hypothetical protein